MITYVKGNLFESPAQVLVNAVNTVGVMGKGIAKDFKEMFPDMFEKYHRFCESKEFKIGQLWLYKTSNKWILNFPTKTTWREPSKLEYLEAGLKNFVETYAERGITSIAFPLLGCGNGELNWETQVRPLMERYLNKLPIDIFIYIFTQDAAAIPEHKDLKKMAEWLQAEPKHLSSEEVYQCLIDIIEKGKFAQSAASKNIEIRVKNSKGFEIRSNGRGVLLPKEDILEFWKILKNYGYIMKKNVPSNLLAYFELLVDIFGELPFVSKIQVAQNYTNLNNSIGLQVVQKGRSHGSLQTEFTKLA